MSYIKENLMKNEKLIYRTTLHWIIFGWTAFFLFWAVVNIGADAAIGGGQLAIAVLLGSVAFLSYSTSEFGVTNKRIMVKVGFIMRKSDEILLPKVEGIQINQGILGRILNYGTVVIRGTGGAKDEYKRIADPMELRRQVQEQIEVQNSQS